MAQGRWWLFGLVALAPLWIAAGLVERPLMLDPAPMRLGGALIGLLWGWLFTAVVLGGAIGASTWHPQSPSWTDRPVYVAWGLLGVGLLLAIAGWPAHRAGHWLDLALLLIAAYALGCGIGWGLREVAETSPGPEVARVLAQVRASTGSGSWALTAVEPSPFGRPAYLSKPGRVPFYVPGTGVVEPREAAAMAAERDAAAGIARPPAVAAPATPTIAERRPYLSKPGPLPFYLPGAGVTDPRTAIAMQPVWRGATSQTKAMSSDAPPLVPSVPNNAAAAAPAATAFDRLEPPSVATDGAAPPVPPPAAAAPVPTPASARPPAAPFTVAVRPVAAETTSEALATTAMSASPESPPSPPSSASRVPEPAPSPPVVDQDKHAGERPPGLISARGDAPDRLQRIKGIGPQNEVRLNALGIWHFAQIAGWTSAHKTWVGSYLAFPGRIDRELWIEQAQVLAAGGAGAKDTPRPRRPRA